MVLSSTLSVFESMAIHRETLLITEPDRDHTVHLTRIDSEDFLHTVGAPPIRYPVSRSPDSRAKRKARLYAEQFDSEFFHAQGPKSCGIGVCP